MGVTLGSARVHRTGSASGTGTAAFVLYFRQYCDTWLRGCANNPKPPPPPSVLPAYLCTDWRCQWGCRGWQWYTGQWHKAQRHCHQPLCTAALAACQSSTGASGVVVLCRAVYTGTLSHTLHSSDSNEPSESQHPSHAMVSCCRGTDRNRTGSLSLNLSGISQVEDSLRRLVYNAGGFSKFSLAYLSTPG